MKGTGLVLAILGGLMIFSSVKLALTKYDLSSSHDATKFVGGFGFSVLILSGGLAMINRSRKVDDEDETDGD